jgi:ADP-heptose:LPS heptosyltransferase
MRPCKCDKCERGQPYTDSQCWTCWKYHNDPLYKELWDRKDVLAVKQMNVECPMRGAEIKDEKGELKTQECESCGGKTRLKVFYCQHPAREPDQITLQDCRSCVYRPKNPDARPIILRNFLSPGDVTCMSAAIYSLHKSHPDKYLTAVETSCNAIYENNPDIIPINQAKDMKAETIEMHYPAIQECNQRGIHFMEAYTEYLESVLNVRIPLKTNKPHLYLSRREKTWMSGVQERLEKNVPFWLICAGRKNDYTAKFWGHENYQELVNRLKGKVLFVQVGSSEHHHPHLKNTLDFVGKTDTRQLIRLVWHAEGGVGGVTFLQHLMAAFDKPYMCIMGGREPVQWNSYPRQQLFHTIGMMPCCKSGGCWRSRVIKLDDNDSKNNELCEQPVIGDEVIPRCMEIIRPEYVAETILRAEWYSATHK